jgi:hypothetical protein
MPNTLRLPKRSASGFEKNIPMIIAMVLAALMMLAVA